MQEPSDRILVQDDPDAPWAPMMKFDIAMCSVDAGIMPPGSAAAEWFLVQESSDLALGEVIIFLPEGDKQLLRVKIAEQADLVDLDRSLMGRVVAWGADLSVA
jgi:hypothetical protein